MRIFPAVFSTRLAALGLAQYPSSPGPIPNRTWPSGHLGVGFAAAFDFGAWASFGEDSFLPLARVTDFPSACLLPSLAKLPSTVTVSPTFSESCDQPARFNSIRLSHSRAQLTILPLESVTSK